MSTTNTQSTQPKPASHSKRRRLLTMTIAIFIVLGICYALYDWLVASHYESTDNAYVQGNIVQITPQLDGTVQAIMVDNTDYVKAGQTLIQLDPADTTIALDKAKANLAQTVRQVRTLYANNASAKAQIALRQAEYSRAQSELIQAQDDLTRRTPLSTDGAVSKEELNHAQLSVKTAQSAVVAANAAVNAAKETLASNEALTESVTVEQHPNVLTAAAQVRDAYLALQRTTLISPVDGYVAQRSVQLGEHISSGKSLLTVIPLKQIWVEANFKENQLRSIRLHQPVTLIADLYGKKIQYHGKVSGLGIGTGAAFSLLPAQNATGNWIKVVQRVPVRITLDEEEITKNPLRIGLSMNVDVDVSNTDGPVLADTPREHIFAQTEIDQNQLAAANTMITQIITDNIGSASDRRTVKE